MLLRKYKIWLLLSVTLTLAYFAPPKDSAATYPDNKLNSNLEGSLFSQKLQEDVALNEPEKIIALRPREVPSEASDTFNVFSADERLSSLTQQPATVEKKMSMSSNKVPSRDVVENLPPQPPPLPFKLLGNYTEDGTQVIFVQHQNQNLVLHVGDIILEKYKLEAVDANSLTFNYLPLDIKQTLK